MKLISLEQLALDRFTRLIGTCFHVLVRPGTGVALELDRVDVPPPRGPLAGSADYEVFTLVFSGRGDQPLGQGMYRFTHEQLGAFDLFIVPIAADATTRRYEAVFNRRRPAAPGPG